MTKGTYRGKLNKSLVALLLVAMGYLALSLSLGTSSPFLLVRGQSMEPTLHAGDMLMQRSVSATKIRVGDIIAFDVPVEGQKAKQLPPKAAHRVIGIQGEGGHLAFVTQGDNSDVDPFKVPASAVHGVVVKNLGPLGKPILLLTNKALLLFVGLPIVAFVLIVVATLWTSPGEKQGAPAPAAASSRTARLPKDVAITLDRLTSAVSAYGVHLKSHTSVIKKMAGSSDGLEEAVQQQNEILAELAAVVREMKHHQGTSGNGASRSAPRRKRPANGAVKKNAEVPEAHVPGNGHKDSANGVSDVKEKPSSSTRASGNGHDKPSNGHHEATVDSHKAGTAGNGHRKSGNGMPPETPAQPLAKEEAIKDMVAEMEAKIKADIGWQG
ncbi:MAG: signal peptidase I [Chloroflexi bacterium]|nr:signal peptidase I [Chloroflexota bacterium]